MSRNTTILTKLEQVVKIRNDIEFVIVDDGSSDGTTEYLSKRLQVINNVKLILQENMGPGGARNTGLANSTGMYVWFVDSDDDFNLDVFDLVYAKKNKLYDFIDFNISENENSTNTMAICNGEYAVGNNIERMVLINGFGRIWSKVFRREFLQNNDLSYVGRCFSDDNALTFKLSLYVKKFYKSDLIGYYYTVEGESISRSGIKPRFFDRLHAADVGLDSVLDKEITFEEMLEYYKRYTLVFFVVTVKKLCIKNSFSGFFTSVRVGRKFRTRFDFLDSIRLVNQVESRIHLRIFLILILLISFSLPNQDSYFKSLRARAWSNKSSTNIFL